MSITITPRTTTVLLWQGDDLDPIVDRAQDAQRAAKFETPRRIGDTDDDAPVHEAVEAFDQLMEEASERAVKVVLVALPRKAYRLLLNQHPVRMVEGEDGPETHQDDAAWGFNRESFGDALVPPSVEAGLLDEDGPERAALFAGVVDGTYVPDPEVSEFLDALADGDFSKLYSASISLNQSPGPDPKVRLSSHLDPTSDETSTSPARLA